VAEDLPRPRRRWGRWIGLAFLLFFLFLVGMVVLALPFRDVQPEADAAKADLDVAAQAIRDGDMTTAQQHVTSAREHVDNARGATHGLGGDLWQHVPVAGGGVRDVRYLVEALDDATSIAEIGVEVYPQVLGDDAKIVQDLTVDMDTLDIVVDAGARAALHARHAEVVLAEVKGTAPLVGDRVAAARDEAVVALEPVTGLLDRAEPFLDVLPGMLGVEREQKYLIAILNPAELRYSGGANTALATVQVSNGVATFDDIGNLGAAVGTNRGLFWPKVPGNTFHPRRALRIQSATWSPYWSVSGEEILRAWAKASREEYDGFVAIDVPAVAALMKITGPMEVPELGITLDGDNLTKTMVGSYDTYADIVQRRTLNRQLIPIFREKLFAGGQFVEKFQVLADQAKARHFAAYFRDPDVQEIVRDLDVDGDLSDTENDYLGVFTQNTNISKADFWLDRTVTSQVKLREDGSADVELTISTFNNAPPFELSPQAPPDPKFGYWTRWSESAIAVMLPQGVETAEVTRPDGTTLEPFIERANVRPYLTQTVWFPPQQTTVMTVRYRVPNAAEVRDDGTLVYRLDSDPQGMVNTPKVGVQLTVPKGYRVASVPGGWAETAGGAGLATTALIDSPSFEIVVEPRG
jgi:hypothetical protein